MAAGQNACFFLTAVGLFRPLPLFLQKQQHALLDVPGPLQDSPALVMAHSQGQDIPGHGVIEGHLKIPVQREAKIPCRIHVRAGRIPAVADEQPHVPAFLPAELMKQPLRPAPVGFLDMEEALALHQGQDGRIQKPAANPLSVQRRRGVRGPCVHIVRAVPQEDQLPALFRKIRENPQCA